MKTKIFINGSEGTTGLRIFERFEGRDDIELLKIPSELRKDPDEVKKYINENPGSTIDIVSEECDVSAKQIKQWIRDERLTFSEESMQGIECEQCGAMIRSGRFCDACKTKLQNELKSATYIPSAEEKKTNRDKDRMRFLQGL